MQYQWKCFFRIDKNMKMVGTENRYIQKKDSLLIFFAGLFIFIIAHSREFTGFNCRFAVFAQEMLSNGPTFFPTTYGKPYPDYPGTSTFLIYVISLLSGKVTLFNAILPTAIISALVLVVIYLIGSMHSRKWGLFAVLFALSTVSFFSLARAISIDQYSTLGTALSFYIIYSASIYNRNRRLWFLPFILVFGFAFRGPIGLVIPAAVICAYYLFNKDLKKFAIMASMSVVLFALCCLALLEAAKYQGGDAFVKQVLEAEITGRIGEGARNWPGYYFSQSFAAYFISYPLAIITIIALFGHIIRRSNGDYSLLFSLSVWMLVVLIGMSVPASKKIRYIEPMIPAAALIGSYMFILPFQNNVLSGIKKNLIQICSWLPFGVTIAILILWALSRRIESIFGANYLVAAIITAALAITTVFLDKKYKEGFEHEFAFLSIGILTFMGSLIFIAEPIDNYHNSTSSLVAKIETLCSQEAGEIVFYRIHPDGQAIKFMANFDAPIQPRFITKPNDILDLNMPAYFIALKEDFESLPENIMQHVKLIDFNKIGRDDCVIFTCRSNQ